ncbi:MAG: enoyl-CoA hydratase-related protein [Anaerolineae bacterium]
MPEEALLFSYAASVATLTFNRPEVLNAIDLSTAETLHRQLTDAERNPEIRAVILTGRGRGFCAGGDLRFALAVNPHSPGDSFLALTHTLHASILKLRQMDKPVIAAINGPAAGAGLFLALACDVRVMAGSAYLKQSNTSYGLSIPAGGTFTLPRLVGLAKALEIALLDEPIPAAHALELGLVNKVVPQSRLLSEAQQLAERLANRPVGALGRVKRLLNGAFEASLAEQLEREWQEIAASANSAEGREGITAFLEKRQPDFMLSGV